MPFVLPPAVRYFILCDDVLNVPNFPNKHMIVGVTSMVAASTETDETEIDKLSAYLVLSGGRGVGISQIECYWEDEGRSIFRTPERILSFDGRNPSHAYGVVSRMVRCRFPEPGVYRFVFRFDGKRLAEQTIAVR